MKAILLIILLILLSSCKKQDSTTITPSELSQTTWIINKYVVGNLHITYYISDTITFINNREYYYNNLKSTYTLYNGYYTYNLRLDGTPWGSITSNIPKTFIDYKRIEGEKFTKTYGTSYYYIWMEKLK